MKHQSFRSLKDSLVGSEPADERHSEPSVEHNEGLLRNADPAVAERIYRECATPKPSWADVQTSA